MSDSFQLQGLQHTRPPCSSPTLRVYSNLCPLRQWLRPLRPFNHLILCSPLLLRTSIIPSSSVFSNGSVLHIRCPKYGSFSFNSVLPMNIQDWFILERTGWICFQSKELSSVFSNTTVQKHQFLSAQLSLLVLLSHPYMTTEKSIAVTRQTFVGKIISLLFIKN